MTELAQIAEALVAFQAAVPSVAKGKTAKVETKSGPGFSYAYADLADIVKATSPLLTENGLAFTARPRGTDHGYELVGVLLHTSGEFIDGSLPLFGNSPQQLGSSVTYARRYLYGCLTGIITDADDDGRAAQSATRTERPPQPMTTKTRGHLFALFGQKGIAEDQQLLGVNTITSADYTSRSQITEEHAQQVIAVLRQRPDAEPAASDPGEASADPADPDDPWKKDQP